MTESNKSGKNYNKIEDNNRKVTLRLAFHCKSVKALFILEVSRSDSSLLTDVILKTKSFESLDLVCLTTKKYRMGLLGIFFPEDKSLKIVTSCVSSKQGCVGVLPMIVWRIPELETHNFVLKRGGFIASKHVAYCQPHIVLIKAINDLNNLMEI